MLLLAKLHVPSSDRPFLERARLLDELDRDARLILMLAPAGSGKTALAINYVQTLARPVVWYSLDSGDSDPAEFLRYLVAGLAMIEPALEEQLASLIARHLHGTDQALALTDAINATLPPATLVLNDVHTIVRNDVIEPRIANVLDALLRHCPHLQVVLVSHQMPPLGAVVAMLARRDALLVNGPVLDFTQQEIDQLWEQTLGAPNPDARDHLLATSSGWAMAVASALRARTPATPADIEDRTVLYAYLANEVLATLPVELRAFLLDTSVLDYLDAARCNRLRQRNDGAHYLAELEQRSLFIKMIDEGVWRYQPLFREFLLDQLRRQPEHHATLLRAAAQLAVEEGRYDWVLEQATEAQAWEIAVDLIEKAGPHLRHTGQHETLLRWLDTSPAHKQTPALWRLRAQVLTDRGQFDAALIALDRAARGTSEDQMMARVLRAQVLQQQGQLDTAAELIAPYLDDEQLPAIWRARALQIAVYHDAYRGAYTDAKQRLHQALVLNQQAGHLFGIARTYHNLGVVERFLGMLDRAEQYYRLADTHWQQLGATVRRCTTLSNLSMVLLERGRLAEAEQQFHNALELAQKYNDLRAQVLILASLGDVALAQGALDEASTRYAAAYSLGMQNGYTRLAHYALACHTHSARLAGDQTALTALLDQLDATSTQSLVEQAWFDGARAGAYWALELPGALASVDEALAVLPPEEDNDRAYLLLLRAQILFGQGQPDAARETFARINEVARHIASVHIFTTWAQAVPELLAQAAEHGDPFAHRLRLRMVASNRALGGTRQQTGAVQQGTERTTGEDREQAVEHQQPPVRSAALVHSNEAVIEPPTLTIRTLGTERILRAGHPINAGGSTTRAVFFCLLAAGTAGLSAETLHTRVWGDDIWSSDALRSAIRRVRRELCPVCFEAGVYTLQLPASVDYDVERFLVLLQRPTTPERLQQAIDLYNGPYLPRYEQPWAVGLRTRLAERYINARLALADILLPTDAAAALEHYQTVLDVDAYHAAAIVALMRAHAALGRRSYALDLYHAYTQRIHKNGLDPDHAVEQVYRQLLDDA